jgi:uncharacterized protein
MENLGLLKPQADALIEKYITDPITKLHCLESEAIMQGLARRFGEDEEAWGIIGLLHDIDWDLTKKDTTQHCLKCIDILKDAGATDFLIETIVSHGYGEGRSGAPQDKIRSTRLQHSLAAAETLTGLIIASALMQPDKKLSSVKLTSLKKKFKSKGFAAGCNRDIILECEKAGVSIDEFLGIGLESLQKISDKLGL